MAASQLCRENDNIQGLHGKTSRHIFFFFENSDKEKYIGEFKSLRLSCTHVVLRERLKNKKKEIIGNCLNMCRKKTPKTRS